MLKDDNKDPSHNFYDDYDNPTGLSFIIPMAIVILLVLVMICTQV